MHFKITIFQLYKKKLKKTQMSTVQKTEPSLQQPNQIQGTANQHQPLYITLSQSSIIRGGFMGAILTALIGFNAGKYSRFGAFRKRMKLVRNFIMPNRKPYFLPITNYFRPNLNTVTKNIQCYSGQPGIGKSRHFKNIVYEESLIRPAVYIPFKASGTNNTFQQDISAKLNYGPGDNPPILSQVILAVRKVNEINTYPFRVWMQVLATHIMMGSLAFYTYSQPFADSIEGILFGIFGTSYLYYMYMIYPFIRQSIRRTKALVVFDDLNKIDDLGKLSQIARYLQLHDENLGNVILITSDEETWFKLRKEPGLKDRLRQRTISYNSKYTAQQLKKVLADDKKFQEFMKNNRVSPLFTKQLILLLIEELINKRQATLRRFMSILVLNDQQRYEEFVQVLKDCNDKIITIQQAVANIAQILLNSQMQTICAKLKHTQRKIKIPEKQFINQMKVLLEKGKLLSDSKIGPSLMVYNILRDHQSEYVFNGKFMYNVFQMAFQQYIKDLEQFYRKPTTKNTMSSQIKFNPELATRKPQIAERKYLP